MLSVVAGKYESYGTGSKLIKEFAWHRLRNRFLGLTSLALASVAIAAAQGTTPTGPTYAQFAPGQPVTTNAYDPPARVGRVSYTSGNAAYHTLDMEYWKEAQFIFPKKAGDSLWIEPGAWAALQLGAGVLHLDREFALVPQLGKVFRIHAYLSSLHAIPT